MIMRNLAKQKKGMLVNLSPVTGNAEQDYNRKLRNGCNVVSWITNGLAKKRFRLGVNSSSKVLRFVRFDKLDVDTEFRQSNWGKMLAHVNDKIVFLYF
jgi:hypothetical protein